MGVDKTERLTSSGNGVAFVDGMPHSTKHDTGTRLSLETTERQIEIGNSAESLCEFERISTRYYAYSGGGTETSSSQNECAMRRD